MTTNFALTLSIEGIELLHRVQHGWKRVGIVDVENKNLDAELASLRKKAEALAPDGLRTKLVIPLDQIKYIAIDSTRTTMDDIHEKLHGATPYSLDDLAIDCERFGGRTHIAAVARETLTEAETFAHAHGFCPVSFVAVPEPFTFQKEVFFGPTSMMTDILGFDGVVERDRLPVMVVGTRIRSRLLVFDLPEDALPPEDEFDLAAALAPYVSTADDAIVPEVIEATPPEPVVPLDVDKSPKPEPEGIAQAEPLLLETVAVDLFADVDPVAEPELDFATNTSPATPFFVDRILPEYHPPSVAVPDVVAAADVDLAAKPELDFAADQPSVTYQFVDRIVPEYHPPFAVMPDVDTPLDAPVIALIPDHPVFAEIRMLDRIIPEVHRSKPLASLRVVVPLTAAAPQVVAPLPKLGAAESAGVRNAPIANEPRKPLLMAGVIAASFALVGVIAWSQMRDPVAAGPDTVPAVPVAQVDVTASTPVSTPISIELIAAAPSVPQIEVTDFGVATDEATTVPFPVAEPAAPTLPVSSALAEAAIADTLPTPVQPAPEPPAQETVQAAVGAPVLRGRVLSPADAAQIYEATGVWQRAPRFVDVPTETSTDGLIRPVTVDAPDKIAQPQVPLAEEMAPDPSFLAPAVPPPADVEFPIDESGFILATPEGTVTPQGAIVYAGAPDLVTRLRPALSENDLARMSLLAPAPDDVVIIAGRPDVVPPLRPANAALPAPEDDVAAAIVDEIANAPTPGGVALSSLDTDATPDLLTRADPALAGARPEPRPSALASTARPTDPGTPDITSIIAAIESEATENAVVGATPQAVVASLRPALRPRNFNQVVDAALARLAAQLAAVPAPAPQQQAAPQQAAAPVAPQNYAPVPGGVARAATQDDVLPLREINLIGVYGRPNARRALVRLGNGRYVRVEVGSALDGGQVTAIGEAALNYVKRGRTYALELPRS